MHLNFTEPAGSGSGFIAFLRKHPKIRFAMRVSFFYIILMIVSVQLLSAGTSHSQGLEDIKVTIELEKGDLKELFKKIENQSGLFFGYQPNQIQSIEVNIPKTTASVKEILDQAFANTSLAYKKEGYSVIVYTRENETTSQVVKDVAIPVTGRVTDKNGNPIPGVSVSVKDQAHGTITDSEGWYSLEVNDSDILLFSFVGYKRVEQALNGRSVIDVSLEEDTTVLSEVQILSTNYFSTTKEKSTMNISKIDGKELENQPVTSLINAIVGRAPGIDITPNSGVAGSASKIQIRGNNSLSGTGSYPLYVIDGVQIESRPLLGQTSGGYDPLAGYSTSDIESVEILKDAAATSIYGSRGANGVIRITTKRAKQGQSKTNFDFNMYTGVGQLANKVDLLNRDQYLAMRHEAFKNMGTEPSQDNLDVDITGVWDTTRSTDWQEVLLGGTATITDVNGSFSGGNGSTSFRIGGGYHRETTIYPGDFNFQRATGDVSFRHLSQDKKLEISAGINFGYTKNRKYNNGAFVDAALTLPPIAPKLYNEDGTLNWQPYDFFGGSFTMETFGNPMTALLYKNDVVGTSIVSSGRISYELLPGLKVQSLFSLTNIYNDETLRRPIAAQPPTSQPYQSGSLRVNNNNRKAVMIEPQLAFDKQMNYHHVNAMIGATWQQSRSIYKSVEGVGYRNDALLGSLQGASTINTAADVNNQYKYASIYFHVGYDFMGKYLVDVTGRRDGSSKFGPDKRYGNFGAIGIGWVFSEEALIKDNVSFISFGKIRSSYGITGNDQIEDYRYLDSYSIISNGYQGGVSLIPQALFNPDYAWENTKKFEIALEFGLLKNRIMFDAVYYQNISSNQLVNYTLASTTGFESVLANFDATIENSGWEFTATTKNISNDKFKWTSSFNLTIPRNELVEFEGIEGSPYAAIYKVGKPLSILNIYKYKGVNPQTGLYELEDYDENGIIDESDKRFMSPLGRTSYYGLSNTITYRNFELSFLLQFSNNPIRSWMPNNAPGSPYNQSIEVLNRWQNEGDKSKFQKFVTLQDQNYSDVLNSDFNTTDASFVRLKTLSISYRFPGSFLERIKLQNLSVYLQGQNLFTITKFNGLDPETGNAMPPLRMLTMGLQLKL